jgi:hypothetical protein
MLNSWLHIAWPEPPLYLRVKAQCWARCGMSLAVFVIKVHIPTIEFNGGTIPVKNEFPFTNIGSISRLGPVFRSKDNKITNRGAAGNGVEPVWHALRCQVTLAITLSIFWTGVVDSVLCRILHGVPSHKLGEVTMSQLVPTTLLQWTWGSIFCPPLSVE